MTAVQESHELLELRVIQVVVILEPQIVRAEQALGLFGLFGATDLVDNFIDQLDQMELVGGLPALGS